MRSPVGGNILVEVDNILPAEGGSIPLVAGIRRRAGEVANHNHHIHPAEEGIVREEGDCCIAYLTTFLAICPRIHDYLTTTVAVADHTHWKKSVEAE